VSSAGRARATLQATGVLVLSCFAGVLTKLALRDVPAFTFVWLQIAAGGALLTLYTFGVRRARWPTGIGRETWASIAWIGIGNFTLVRVFSLLALARLPATTHIYLVNFTGIVTMAMSAVVLHERPAVLQIAGAVVAMLGLRVFFRDIPPPTELAGVAYLAVAVVALASTNTLARRLGRSAGQRLSNDVVSTLAVWTGGIPVVLYGVWTDWPPRVPGPATWGIIVLNAVVGIAFAPTVWNHVLRTLRSYEASLLASTTVIYTALFALPILGERLDRRQAGGIVLMLAGLALVQLRRRDAAAAPVDRPARCA
jgi:probable blue pigment (indigoidine) exporter